MSKPTLSLVLGGGGARGLAHIGIIDALEELGFKITSIYGTSIGAVVGGAYAAGGLKEYTQWVTSLKYLDVIKMIDPTFSKSGLIKGDKVVQKLKEIVGDTHIESLDIPFTAVATQIKTGKEQWFKKGLLIDAIRASMAVPNIFVPVTIDGVVYVDGGVLNPVPVSPTVEDSSDYTIAVTLNGKKTNDTLKDSHQPSLIDKALEFLNKKEPDFDKKMGYLEITTRSIDIMQESISRFKLASTPPDALIEIPKDICAFFDFHKAQALIDFGKKAAYDALKNHPTISIPNNKKE